MTSPSPYAQRLDHVPERFRVPETLGLQPGIWGTLFLLVACHFAFGGKGPRIALEWTITAASGALGLALTGYEAWRRRNRTVLVRDGEEIAVFRKCRFDLAVAPGEIRRIEADAVTMLKIGVPLGLAGLLFTVLGISIAREGNSRDEGTMILLFGLACWASLASAAWTRFSCRHLRVPIKGSKWFEESVLVRRKQIRKLYPDEETGT